VVKKVLGMLVRCKFMVASRYILTILIIGVALQLYGQHSVKDTTFIVKNKVFGRIRSIFIDNNKNSSFYRDISSFDATPFEKADSFSLNYLRKDRQILTKTKIVIPYKKWVALYQYKGKFYVYRPSDFLNHFMQSVNDSIFIDWTGEGPIANKIITHRKINRTTYEFKLTGIYDANRTILIHIIDFKKGIAIFEQTVNDSATSYYLMIAADKIRSVPVIVNHSSDKQAELEFDEIDFVASLAKK
jgi:hypothetical protein